MTHTHVILCPTKLSCFVCKVLLDDVRIKDITDWSFVDNGDPVKAILVNSAGTMDRPVVRYFKTVLKDLDSETQSSFQEFRKVYLCHEDSADVQNTPPAKFRRASSDIAPPEGGLPDE